MNVLEGNLQWNSWICKMIDNLKGSIVKFQLKFEKALENKRESKWWQISSETLVCLERGNLTIVNNLYFFKISSYQNIFINFDLFPKNDNGYFVAYFDLVYSWNLV